MSLRAKVLLFVAALLVLFGCCFCAYSGFQSDVAYMEANTKAFVAWGWEREVVTLLVPSAQTFSTQAEALEYLSQFENDQFAYKCNGDSQTREVTYSELVSDYCEKGLVAVYK